MAEKPIHRVAHVIKKYCENNVSLFEKSIGAGANSIQIAIKRETSLKDVTLISILEVYNINPEWLLLGVGNELKEKEYATNENNVGVSDNEGVYSVGEKFYNSLKKDLEENNKLLVQLTEKLNTIKLTEEKIDELFYAMKKNGLTDKIKSINNKLDHS